MPNTHLLALATLLLCTIGASARPKEAIEWSRMWFNGATDETLPRVVLIGDSITEGYQGLVTEELAGVANVGYWTSSKCVSDPSFATLLGYVLDEFRFSVIHFNNGLHSLTTEPAAWAEGLGQAFEMIAARGQGAKVVWAPSTPIADEGGTARVRELNALAAPLAAARGWAVDDLFTLADGADHATLWSDGVHFHEAARRAQAKQVADSIRALLPARP